MKVLVVMSGNSLASDNDRQIFVMEQIKAISQEYNVQFEIFYIRGKNILGYLKNLLPLIKKLIGGNFDLVHAHYGFSGLLASLQLIVPVVVTFHGTDLNEKSFRKFSLLARKLAHTNIFVSKQLATGLLLGKRDFVVPCGVDQDIFSPMDKTIAMQSLGLDLKRKYILFPSSFDNKVKNYPLAQLVVKSLDIETELIELKNKSRQEVNLLLNAVDLLLLTSFSEGSPQLIKEAMSCNCPIVSTDVGDIREVISDTINCKVSNFDLNEMVNACMDILNNSERSNGRDKISHLDNRIIAKKIMAIYAEVVH